MGRGGTGLGMHIVHSIVTRVLGGHVVVDSQPGQGSRVVVEFSRSAPVARE
jgi:signal transduction histidine kinase